MEQITCCGSCRWYKPDVNPDTGRVRPAHAGTCSFPITWPTLPAAFCMQNFYWPDRCVVWPSSGYDCKTFEAKPVAPAKPVTPPAKQETLL